MINRTEKFVFIYLGEFEKDKLLFFFGPYALKTTIILNLSAISVITLKCL